ncbi:unnamed protein product [Sphagnum balticum]
MVEVMVERFNDIVMVEVVKVVGVVEVHQWLEHLSRPLFPLRQKQLWLLGLSSWSRGLLPWQVSSIDHIQKATTAKMDALPARPAIDREGLTPNVCMLDNRSGIFQLVSPMSQVYKPDRVLLDFSAQPLTLGKAACIGLGDLLESNISTIDTPVYEDIEEVFSFVATMSFSLDVPLWCSNGVLRQDADCLVSQAWHEAFVLMEEGEVPRQTPIYDVIELSPLDTTPIAWEYHSEGICVLDLFGGISTGLATML